MSETPVDPGWWQASDGRWYPPESRPVAHPPPPPLGQSAPPPPPARPMNSNAVISLVFGILGLTGCGPFLGVPAIILAGKAQREIKESGGAQSGEGLATAGRILGWIATVLFGIAIVMFLAIMVLAIIFSSPEAAYMSLRAG